MLFQDSGRTDEPLDRPGPASSRPALPSRAADARRPAGTSRPADVARPAAPPPAGSPAWFEIGLLACVVAIVCCGGLGLALAVAGHYSAGASLGGGLALTAVLTSLGARALRGGPRPAVPTLQAPAVVATVLALVSAVGNGWRSGAWINIDRDPAAYAMAGRWIADHGSLEIPFGDSWAFTGIPVTGSSAAVYVDGDHLEFQFNHLLPVLLAQVRGVAGDRAMLSANAVIVALGLLAVYAVGVRLTGRPWLVVLATSALGISLPVLFVARATFSEGVTMLLVWAGAWLLLLAWDRASFVLSLLGGASLGAAAMARVDSLVYLLVLPLLAAGVAVAGARDARWRRIATLSGAALLGGLGPVILGSIDVMTRAGNYYRDLAAQIRPLQTATIMVTVGGIVLVLLARLLPSVSGHVASFVARHREWIGRAAAVVVVLTLVFAWAIRPAVDHPVGPPNPTVLGLQQQEGLAIQPGRLYAEQSMVWMSWYLGPVTLAISIVGLGVLVLAAARARSAALVVLAVAGAGTALYLYRLSNTPDQLFGVRRFVPAAMPLFVLGLAVALSAVPARLPDSWRDAVGTVWRRWRRPVAALVAVGVLAFPLGAVSRVWDFSPRRGALTMFDETCAALPPNAAVIFPKLSYGSLTYPQVIRDFCGVPVASGAVAAGATLSVAQLRQAAAAWRTKGRTLWVVDSERENITTLYGATADVRELGHAVDSSDIADTLSRPPTYHVTWDRAVFGMPVPD